MVMRLRQSTASIRSVRRPTGVLGVLVLAAAVLGMAVPAGAAGSPVVVEGDSATIDTLQSVDSTTPPDRFRQKHGQDFVGFSESLNPATLTGIPGSADAFVSQASSVITPSFSTPFSPVRGIGVSGRLTAKSHKNNNGAAFVPFASPEGFFSADFNSTDPIPIQFAGFMQGASTDPDDCTSISVELSGPFNRTFEAGGGGDCSAGVPRQKGWVVEKTVPAGDYQLNVSYDTTVDPEQPGRTDRAHGAVDVILAFHPPDTKITKARINPGQGKATFRFKTIGNANRLQCALVRGHRDPKFRGCTSPKTYRDLKSGRYKFETRAVTRVGPDATPAIKKFRIP
jgi:hypothetical protein